ncbi:MAG TPA: sensor histidine kinase, partial [Actinomycetes bacterium]|nr:sensor histidine kinase [Actinomycetes bacterium]
MEAEDTSPQARWRPPTVDVVLALALAVVQVLGTWGAGRDQPEHGPLGPFGVVLLVLGPLALVVRRRYPVPVFTGAAASTLTYLLLDYPRGPVWFAMIVGLATMVMAGQRVAAITAITVGYVAFSWGPYWAGVEDAPSLAVAVGLAAWLLVLLTGSELLRARRDRAVAAARSREEEARRRVSDERLRIARELHDVVAHNISMINLQAGVALHLIDERPEQARTALAAIKDASKEALVELRSVLGVLRQVDEQAPRDPAPGLGRLPDLIAQANAAGLAVQVTVDGDARPLPRSVDLAAFRIVQEALTNVSRHAGTAAAQVRVVYAPGHVAVEVVDDGRGAAVSGEPSPGSGQGLTGMRERAQSLGGEFEAGPRPGFGWRVLARLPVPTDEEAPAGDP